MDTTPDEDLDEALTARERIKFTAKAGYKALEKLTDDELFGNADEEITGLVEASNVAINYDPEATDMTETNWDWASIVEEAMKEPEETPKEPEAEPQKEPVNLGLLFSLLASVALVGALLIVVVVKIFKKRNKA